MEVIKHLQKSIVYIEDHLLNNFSLQEISDYIGQTPYHLNQSFLMIIGMTPLEYQHERRMSEAALDILHGQGRIIDVANRYGYCDANSFAHDFYQHHSISPLQVKTHRSSLKLKRRVSLKITATETEPLDYTLLYKNDINLVGKNYHFTAKDLENPFLIPDLLEILIENHTIEDMVKYNDVRPHQLLVIRKPLLDGLEVFVGVPSERYPNHLDNYYLPSNQFAVFNLQGELDFIVNETWLRIENQWQLTMPYKHNDFYVEVYPLDVNFNQETTKLQMWVPISHN